MNNRIWSVAVFSLVISIPAVSHGQSVKNILGGLKGSGNTTKSQNQSKSLSQSEVVGGLKQALEIGAQKAGADLSRENGFLHNPAVKLLLPEEVRKAEATMRSFGMGKLADEAIVLMNRAAEDASKQAAPIFIQAIRSMSIQDGVKILTGGNQAATNYLKSNTVRALTQSFRPVIQKSLNKYNVDQYWTQLFQQYNKLPLVNKQVNPDLTGYVTEKAIDGLFKKIAEEETAIRQNPAARATDLLQKVFGSL